MITKNIVIAPCGNKSYLFKDSWLKYQQDKQFDLCLLFYHEEIKNPELYSAAEYFFHLKGFKYHMLYRLFTEIHPEWLGQYDYFYFLDDDVEIDTHQINSMFFSSRAFSSSISQASLTQDSFCSWPIFKQQQNSYCRFVGQIEVMAPLFDSPSLERCLPSFIGNRSSWGVDAVWSKILGYPKDKLIVFDSITMRHTQVVMGGELYQKIGVDPGVEWEAITAEYGAKKENYQEYGRLQFVNEKSNRLKFRFYKLIEFFARRRRALKDYDIPSRIESRKNKLFKKGKLSSH